jgi:hypothetical protein
VQEVVSAARVITAKVMAGGLILYARGSRTKCAW